MIYRTCLRYWRLALITPLLYLLICAVVKLTVFDTRVTAGFYPLGESFFTHLRNWLLAAGGAAALLVLLLRRRWWVSQRLLEDKRTPEAIRRALVFRYLTLLIVCDTIAFTGCVLFLIQGGLQNMLYFAIAAMIAYAAAHPQQLPIDRLYHDSLDNESQHD